MGEQVIERLAKDLSARFGRGFARRNLFQMRAFYLAHPKIVQTPSALSPNASSSFPLLWSHYVRLLSIDDLDASEFYETEALRGGWSVRQLDRQVSSMFYRLVRVSSCREVLLEDPA